MQCVPKNGRAWKDLKTVIKILKKPGKTLRYSKRAEDSRSNFSTTAVDKNSNHLGDKIYV